MANLKDVRLRIDSVKSTKQITAAMKMVSAAKLRKAQNAIQAMRPYARKLAEIIFKISSDLLEESNSDYMEQRKPEKILLIAIASNRGLCGPFNANIAKAVVSRIENIYPQQYQDGNVEIMTIGKKAFDLLKSRKIAVQRRNDEILDDLAFDNVQLFVSELMKEYSDKKYDRIELIYNQFKNAAVYVLNTEQFLPVQMPEFKEQFKRHTITTDYIFEPSKKEIVERIIPKSLKLQFFSALLDSQAAEQGARMTAMHKATDNADELLKNLKLSYNKARQAAITSEILEIVSGANALND
jgi:F-type H+-transporting ATPase subunit gamma